jgi:hypothetical protein
MRWRSFQVGLVVVTLAAPGWGCAQASEQPDARRKFVPAGWTVEEELQGDLDGDGIALLVLAVALILAIFVTSGYLIWFAPDILSEAAFGAVLAGGLARRSRNQDPGGWIAGVVKKTWWPFAVVLAFSVGFAWYSAQHFPAAHTFREAVAMALNS